MKRFAHWFMNSFWYHYKWQTVGALLVFVFIALFVRDIATRENPDFTYLLVHDDIVIDEQLTELSALAEEVLPDINGDGRVIVRGQALTFYDDGEIGMSNRIRLQAMLTDGMAVLYLLDESNADHLTDTMGEVFGPLSAWGLPSDEDCSWRLRVENCPLVRRMGFSGEEPLYVCLRDWTEDMQNDPDIAARYEAAALVVGLLLETE